MCIKAGAKVQHFSDMCKKNVLFFIFFGGKSVFLRLKARF